MALSSFSVGKMAGYFATAVMLHVLTCLPATAQTDDLSFYAQRLSHGSTDQKRDALFELRNLHTPEASRTAATALSDSAEIVRATAAGSVIFLPPSEAAAALAPLLKDKSILVRREAALALGRARGQDALIFLRILIAAEKISEVRAAAAIGLGQLGNIDGVPSLTVVLNENPKESDEFLRRSAARSIGRIAGGLQPGDVPLTTPASLLPEKYQPALISRRNMAIDYAVFRPGARVLIKILQTQSEAPDTKREAAFALGEISDPSAVEVLKANLNNPDYYLVQICMEALRKINAVQVPLNK